MQHKFLVLLLPVFVGGLVRPTPIAKQQQRQRAHHESSQIDDEPKVRRHKSSTNHLLNAAVGAALAASLATMPMVADASYAPSSAAVTSAPPARRLDVDDLSQISSQKLKQRQGQLSTSSLDILIQELETSLKNLRAQIEGEFAAETGKKQEPTQREAISDKIDKQAEYASQFQKQIDEKKFLEMQPAWFNYLAAACASVVSTVIMHPVDTLKIRLQSKLPLKLDLSLYSGLASNVIKEAPSSALYLGVYEAFKSRLLETTAWGPDHLLLVYLLGGALGELCGSVIRAPAEAVKSVVQSGRAPNTIEAVKLTLMEPSGRQRVARAWSSSIWRDVPFGAIQIAIFEGLKVAILNSQIDLSLNSLQSEAVFGAFGGFIGSYVTTPFDVLTTMIILSNTETKTITTETTTGELGSETTTVTQVTQVKGIPGLLREVWEEGGIRALFRGATERSLYWAPAISLFLTAYCSIRHFAAENNLFEALPL